MWLLLSHRSFPFNPDRGDIITREEEGGIPANAIFAQRTHSSSRGAPSCHLLIGSPGPRAAVVGFDVGRRSSSPIGGKYVIHAGGRGASVRLHWQRMSWRTDA
ncbi:unnamed protein product [Pleuronectes platessa]|uniref:Uncharacterized protein n=1 Tax=Pleuronectes platessa TaxID=8262 RepID=A0A9N7YER6_PLEPL|nr:unnamed protein product [Pleuronectes platessa]